MPRLTPISFVGVCLSFALFLTVGAFARDVLAASGCDTVDPPTTVLYLPNVTKTLGGPSGWVTPSWFDEGNARAEEFTVAGTRWWAALQRYYAASMAAQDSLFTLADLTSGSTWSQRSATDAPYQYAVATQAVQFLRADLAMSGELLLFDLMAQGRTFDEAYGLVAGQPCAEFDAGFAARVRALAPTYPGVAAALDSQTGPGLTFIAYGLPPNTAVSYAISGTSSSRQTTRTTDAYGFFYTYIDSAWPAGSYTMTVNWSGGSVSGSGVKAN